MKGCKISKSVVQRDCLEAAFLGAESSLLRKQIQRLLCGMMRGEGNGSAFCLPVCVDTYRPHRLYDISTVFADDSFLEELPDITLLCKWRQAGYAKCLLTGIHGARQENAQTQDKLLE